MGGTFGGGLYIFNTENHSFRRFRNNPHDPTSLPDDAVWQILITSDERIWLGLGRGGISLFDESQGTFSRYDYAYGTPGAPAFGASLSLFEDNNKIYGLGTTPVW